MNLCVIPARGGSKRIPNKNIRKFNGKPLIQWSIETALNSNCFADVIVSTDNKDIMDIAVKSGAQVPFIRPGYLADDFTDTRSVVAHAITVMREKMMIYRNICCLYPTAPFVVTSDLLKGMSMARKDIEDSFIFPVTSYSFPIERSISIDRNGKTQAFDPKKISKRSQDLKQYYHDCGLFYIAKESSWMKNINILENGKPIIIPRYRSEDIDTEEDFVQAELKFQILLEMGLLDKG